MITRREIDDIRALADKKVRENTGLFVAEGEKLVLDLLQSSLVPTVIYTVPAGSSGSIPAPWSELARTITSRDMERISAFRSPPDMLAIFSIPASPAETPGKLSGLGMVLDRIQDPGNLGTIVRTADWFGIRDLYCSKDCADVYGPKCVQSTMGSIARVRVRYTDLPTLLEQASRQKVPVFGTYMNGENLYQAELPETALLVMGSEGKGISPELEPFLNRRIAIPPFPAGKNKAESLNVAVSASIICAEFRRRRAL